ncbi:MinD/ParA family protein [Kitasatospora sp. NPDC127060]|uniref:MinD/ParA family ATP-binding protein n=1 Tax=Kitasatospora sp. NPDC127060 TaxID=3347121 RepID=UPI003665EE33
MALVAVASAKGAPGVSTVALAMAAVWPRRSLLAECDQSGGDLVYRHKAENGRDDLDPRLGMLSLAVAGRTGISPATVWEHAQRAHGGLEVLLGLASPEQCGAWQGMWPALGRGLVAIREADVIADLGRIGPASPGLDLLPMASLVVLVARTTTAELAAVRDRALALSERLGRNGGGPPIGVLLIDDKRHHAKVSADVNRYFLDQQVPAEVFGCLPIDNSGAAQLAGRKSGKVEKSELVRAVKHVVANIHGRYGVGAEQAPTPVPAPARAEALGVG